MIVVYIDGIEYTLRIEHKFRAKGKGLWKYRTGRASPLHPNRLWHFLISQTGDGEDAVYVCVGRHEVRDVWIDGHANIGDCNTDNGSTVFSGSNAVARMLERIVEGARAATDMAETKLAAAVPGDISVDELFNSGTELERYEPYQDHVPEEDDDEGEERKIHARGLP